MAITIGTPGDDVLQPGPGDDTAFLLNGTDRFTWNPGDGNDTVLGGRGADTLVFNGADAVESFTISGDNDDVELFRNVGNILMNLNQVEAIELNALGEDDVIDASNLRASDVDLIVNGGTGNDRAFLGAGDDDFIWNPGDGSDFVNGRAGTDTLVFNGADAPEEFTITDSVNGVELFRDVGNITMDLKKVEQVEVNGLGDDDLIDASGMTRRQVALSADGGDGADSITGGAGDDTLAGGNGTDILDGGEGNDLLLGGADADKFKFTGTNFGNDIIGDWASEDILALDQVQLADGTAVTDANQIDTNADGLLNVDDDPFDVVDGDLVLTLQGGSATIAGLDQIGANLEIA